MIQLDTPGGLLESTTTIVKDILGAPLPVIVYVAPSGAGATSAGVFITMAAHVAAMAPGHEHRRGASGGRAGRGHRGDMGEKVENFTASFSEAIAQQRGRNVEWAEKAVRESVSITADEAAKLKVVDFVATRPRRARDAQPTGRTVEVAGTTRTLDLAPTLRRRRPRARRRLRDAPRAAGARTCSPTRTSPTC